MEEWEKISEEVVYNGFGKLEKWEFKLPNGLIYDFEIKIAGCPVCVLALTPENKVILAKQFRPGPGKILLELPGGGKEKGESPLEAIKRELLEETGYSGNFQFVANSYGSAYSTLHRGNFVATNCKKVAEPQNAPREPIEVVEMELEDFRQYLRSGDLTDVATGYLGLDFLGLL